MIKKISIMLLLLGNMLILKGEAAVLLEKGEGRAQLTLFYR